MKSVSGYLQGTVQSVQTLLGNSKETNGPEGAVASKTIRSVNMINQGLARLQTRGGGGYSIYPWVGMCSAAPHTLTLFKTNIADFPTLFKTEFRFLIPCLRHLSCLRQKLINRYRD